MPSGRLKPQNDVFLKFLAGDINTEKELFKSKCTAIIILMVKNILLTGSGGFVGKNLKEYFSKKYSLLCPRSFELDLRNYDSVKSYFEKNNVDFIIHCASTGGVRGCDDPVSCEVDNLNMLQNLLKLKRKDARIITFGSGAAYAKDRNLHKVKESQIGDVIPKDLYGKSKMESAKIALTREDMLCLNIFACYGKYEKESRFPSYAIMQNLKKEPVVINQNVIFDYLYIADLCRIVECFIKNQPKNKVINVTPENSISLFEIAQTVNKISGYKSPISFKACGMNFEYTGDNSLLLEEIPDFKFTSIEEGLSQLFYHCKNLLNAV